MDLANSQRHLRIDSLNSAIRIFGDRDAHPYGDPLLIAARHHTEGYPLPRTDDRDLLSVGWRTIASSRLFEVSARGSAARRWGQRLAPRDPTALHAVLADEAQDVSFYTDPTTRIPVVRKGAARQGSWAFLAPLRLPDQAVRLRSVILEDTAWVRTDDDRIYPGPCTPDEHLWWGPGGGDQPAEAAWVIAQLLDDISKEVSLADH
ncbi:hypothetical protein AB0899_22740 [Streptomyces sp. NPDC007002]|uniref:hypothetical protein n=1 Tax=Streptomyces sp. NPDC007002 TaxID=3156910 RepID=UPI003454BF70